MKPLRLTLKGFTGIRDGAGRADLTIDFERLAGSAPLVALVGPNGSGKTTIIDNAHPYRLMPSRATSASVGGFSFYEQLCAPEAGKDLEWLHEGRRFRSQLVFRMNGARRTEAFLHEWREGRWQPVVMPDGTRSDGKTETYDRCIEGLLGSPETFFTSAFHAQNRRHLCAYRPGEVKALLVELLGLARIRRTGVEASRVSALLHDALDRQREALARHRAGEQSVRDLRLAIVEAQQRLALAQADRQESHARLQSALDALAAIEQERAAGASTQPLRTSLQRQMDEQTTGTARMKQAHDCVVANLNQRVERAAAGLRAAEQTALRDGERVRRDLASARALLDRHDAIRGAVETLPHLADEERTAREGVARAEAASQAVAAHRQRLQVIAASRAGLVGEAGAAALRAQQLRQRLQLTEQVPCRGTALQAECRLLADAREAKALQPSADRKIVELEREVRALDAQRAEIERQLADAGDPGALLARTRASLDAVLERRRALTAQAALMESVMQAKDRRESLSREAGEIEQRLCFAKRAADDECEECKRMLNEAQTRHAAELLQADQSLQRLAKELSSLPPPFDEGRCRSAEQAVREARRSVEGLDARCTSAVAQRAELEGRLRAAQAGLVESRVAAEAVSRLETELALWTALAKSLGNDGVIALCIDDAGPTLARLANELLLGCYGPRFTVSITTQVESAKKELKEGFDVIVFDAETGASKSVAMMSGGERVWIDEALTRSIAVYLAQSAGRRYQTLFSDEADGPLDPERKRKFIAMKREVLRLGGYEQEMFVSQTPQLWELADAVIDVGALGAAVPADIGASRHP